MKKQEYKIYTKKNLPLMEDDRNSYVDSTDNTSPVQGSETSASGITDRKNAGQKNPTTDQFGNMVSRQNYWWSRAGGGAPLTYSMTKEELRREALNRIIESGDLKKKV
jgi:hypothetical protein